MPSSSSFLIKIKEHILPLAVVSGLLGLMLFLYAFSLTYRAGNPHEGAGIAPAVQEESEACCVIEVTGAVQLPGVYKITRGKYLQDALIAAGGFRPDADAEFVAKELKLGQEIMESQKIFVPAQSTQSATITQNTSDTSRISVNTSTLQELDTLPYIGEKTAQKIIDGRPFSSIDDFFARISFSVSRQIELRELIQL